MQCGMGPQEDGHQVRNNEGHPDEREGAAQNRPNPRSDLEIERVAATERGQHFKAQGGAGQDAERALIQEALAVVLTVEADAAEGPAHKEDKIAAEVARGGPDLREVGGPSDGHAGQADLKALSHLNDLI